MTHGLLQRACERLGVPIQGVDIAAGQTELPEDLPKSPLIVHGATTMVKLAGGDPRFRHGVFYEPDSFCHEAYTQGFGDAFINAAARLVTLDEALAMLSNSGNLFVKPPDDLKAFTGFVATRDELDGLIKKHEVRGEEFPERIVIAPVAEVDAEWRLFVVDGEVITGSQYRPGGDPELPVDLLEFARGLISQWTPAPVFVLDIGRVDSGWKVIECNCFNWSRFYESNVPRIVEVVSAYQASRLKRT